VRVLLARAAAKLGVRTRDDLLRTVPEFKVRPNLPRTAGQA
jgi:hypothetical protein